MRTVRVEMDVFFMTRSCVIMAGLLTGDAKQIKMKSDAGIARYDKDGLVFDDGTKVEADVIVYATGFVGNMRNSVRDMLGEEVAGQVEDFWGLNEEGELKGAYKPSGREYLTFPNSESGLINRWAADPHLWLHGGTCGQARFFSRFIALQIRAELDGTPLLDSHGEN